MPTKLIHPTVGLYMAVQNLLQPVLVFIGEAFGSGIKISSIGAAVSVFASCLSGGTAVSQIADEVKNPRRDVPLALILAPVIVAFIYILMAVVTLGCMNGDTVTTLSDVAKGFMAPGLVVFLVVGGPLCGVLTSMVPVIMLTCAQIQAAADCGVFPKALAKKNKNGVSTGILIYVMLFAIICVLTGSSFGVLMTVFSAVNALSDIPTCIVPFFLKKKYPHACNHAGIKFKYGMIIVLSVFAAVVAAFLAFSAFKALGASVYLIILAYMAAAVIYFIARINYLKGKGRNLIEELKTPYDEWEAREAECKAMDEAK